MLERLIEIFKKSISSSGLLRDPEPSDSFIRDAVTLLLKAIAGEQQTEPEKAFWEFTGLRHSHAFGHRDDIVSQVNHALCFNEAFISILLARDLTNCPGVVLAYAGQFLQNYGSNHKLRLGFVSKLDRYYRSPTLTSLQRLYLYCTVLYFQIKPDNTTEIPGIALATIESDAREVIKGISNSHDPSETIVMARYVLAWAMIKENNNDPAQRDKIDARAIELLEENHHEGHKVSTHALARMYDEGRVKGSSVHAANAKAVTLYRDTLNDEGILASRTNLAMMHYKGRDIGYTPAEGCEAIDDEQQISLSRQAASYGFIRGICNLASFWGTRPIHIQSNGSLSDPHTKAKLLLELVVSRGYEKAKPGLNQLNQRIAEASPAASSTSSTASFKPITTSTGNPEISVATVVAQTNFPPPQRPTPRRPKSSKKRHYVDLAAETGDSDAEGSDNPYSEKAKWLRNKF